VTTRFSLMDSVRALAALSVLVHHALPIAGVYRPGTLLGPYSARLDSGVAIFFVVSGCLLYRPFVVAMAQGERLPGLTAYAWRRALRIFPAYWVVLSVALVTTVSLTGLAVVDALPQFVLTQNYFDHKAALPQAWTLCVEVSFYAFVPAFAALLARRSCPWLRAQIVALGSLCVVSLVWNVWVLRSDAPLRGDWLPAYLDQFALGMGLAVLSVWLTRTGSHARLRATLTRWSGVGWLLAAAAYLASTRIGLPAHLTAAWYVPVTDGRALCQHALYSVIGLGVTLPAVLGSAGLVHRVLAWRPLLALGKISYSIYLWHFLVLHEILPKPPSFVHPYLWYTVGGAAITVILAALSYRFVEAPASRLGHLAFVRAPVPIVTAPTPTPASRAGP
jgi:peptidoglycan/LPS O-acetylase OafA/YrhL